MTQQTVTVLGLSRTEYDDSNFPTTDVFANYINADLRDAKGGAVVAIRNTSPDQKPLDAKVRVSASPSLTLPDGSDDSWIILTSPQNIVDGMSSFEIPPLWSWCRIDLKNTNAGDIAQAKVWLKIKLV